MSALADKSGENGHRILYASLAPRVLGWLEPSLPGLNAHVLMAESGHELERMLLHRGPFSLVVASAQLSKPSGLQVLARARSHGIHTPFIIVLGFHGDFVRVMVSDVSSVTLSSRVVDMPNFVALVMSFVTPPTRPTKPCGPP